MEDIRLMLTEVYRSEKMQRLKQELFAGNTTISINEEEFEAVLIMCIASGYEMGRKQYDV